jgi:BMFP domain-containing protein YqiC
LRLRRTIAIVLSHSKRCTGFVEAVMVQTTNRFFDEVARLMNDAAGVAQGVRREFETLFRTQAERWLRDLDLVKREDFEAVKDMARIAREDNEALKGRVAALETALASLQGNMQSVPPAAPPPAAPQPYSEPAPAQNFSGPPPVPPLGQINPGSF